MGLSVFIKIRNLVAGVLGIVLLLGASVALAQFESPKSVSVLAAALSPAVVNIATSHPVAGGGGDAFPEFGPDTPLYELFNDINPNSGEGQERMGEARSLGSGFIISEQGYVITNSHVIAGASEILIFTTDGERYVAELMGADQKTDLALLQIKTDEPGKLFNYVEFGDSDGAEVGDWVMAIGNPFGLGGSVSLGIVSARNRNINAGPYDDFIQTDAAINLGNSGGPLFDMNGDVVGIVTAIIASGGNSRGIGFAIPSNLAQPVLDHLIAFGEVRRGWLGVGIDEVTQEIATSLGMPDARGAVVREVTRGGPSEGILEVGDVIEMFGFNTINKVHDLPRFVAQTPIGEQTCVQVFREGRSIDLIIQLGDLREGEQIIASNQISIGEQNSEVTPNVSVKAIGPRVSIQNREVLGFALMELTDEIRQTMGRGRNAQGLLVTCTSGQSQAFMRGVRSGQLLEQINKVDVQTIAEFEAILAEAIASEDETILLTLTDSSGITFAPLLDLP